jgi:hypothetical protein
MLKKLRGAANLILGKIHPEEKRPNFAGTLGDIDRKRSDSLSDIYYGYKGPRLICKWDHYLPIYSKLLAPYRNRPLRFLEIGVSQGGSLELWRTYFGSQAIIFGIDIDPTCARFSDEVAQVRIGSQDDPQFLASVTDEMGGIDVVLDDGSHIGSHQIDAFNALFPRLNDDGLYLVEDLHTAYWRSWKGGLRRRGTFIEFAKALADDMNGWYHSGYSGPKHAVGGVHFYDAIVAIEKQPLRRPIVVDMPEKKAPPGAPSFAHRAKVGISGDDTEQIRRRAIQSIAITARTRISP